MKKSFYGLIIIWLCLFNVTAFSNTNNIAYEITFDSNKDNEIIYRDHIFEVYERVTYGIDDDKVGTVINKNLDMFKVDSEDQISYINSTIIIIENNGLGSNISGNFNYVKCKSEVVVKSWVKEKIDAIID